MCADCHQIEYEERHFYEQQLLTILRESEASAFDLSALSDGIPDILPPFVLHDLLIAFGLTASSPEQRDFIINHWRLREGHGLGKANSKNEIAEKKGE